MNNQRWYQKASVQTAIVTGVFGIIYVIISFVLKTPSSGDSGIVATQNVVPSAPRPENVPNFDRVFSPESVAARRALRGNLRNLSAAESQLKVQQVPAGTFGFSHSLLFRFMDFEVDRFPNGRLSFEIHKIAAEEVYAVVFVNADTQRKLQLDSRLKEPATVYSDIWKDAPYAVRIIVSSCEGESRAVMLDDEKMIKAVDCRPATRK